MVNERYGSNHVAYTLLIQSLPPLLLSKLVREWFSKTDPLKTYIVASVIAVVNVASLAFDLGLTHLYIYMVISSLISTVTTPLFFVLLGHWVNKSEFEEVHNRLSAINPIILTLAPPVGGVLATAIGNKALFIISAALYVISAVVARKIEGKGAGRQSGLEPQAVHATSEAKLTPSCLKA